MWSCVGEFVIGTGTRERVAGSKQWNYENSVEMVEWKILMIGNSAMKHEINIIDGIINWLEISVQCSVKNDATAPQALEWFNDERRTEFEFFWFFVWSIKMNSFIRINSVKYK